ncbi:formate dehydrogenase subunit gamma [Rhodophyticola porphyridii]|uniref:Formate dehydrogenase subunit gamma n=1 Tax=Rhodophyticola porphyridii TaxID=1852017 RepID=A0A3L9XYH0_9RHOB|nr:formate dehydrogenase subunit gamma [Rhodophyticola porphyridii]RMA41564.1 formate dehydrogenase subunit gamma [Rhodophyticola porphyridii]
MTIFTKMSRVIAVLALGLFAVIAQPQAAQAQDIINPTAESVTEDALMEALNGDAQVQGRVSIPDDLSSGLIKPANRGWADTHGGPVRTVNLIAVVGMIVLLVAFYAIRGKIRIDSGPSSERIQRFSATERFAHWLMAVSFIVLALTGLNLVFGRAVILPVFGEGVFGTLSAWGKVAHNYMGFAFMLGLILSFVYWIAHNIPDKVDMHWLSKGGGLFVKGVHPPAKKFNAGQKGIFWSVTLGGAALSFTGVMLLFPELAGGEAGWQLYQVIHGVVAAILTAIVIAHIYIGSVGMEGAYDAMGSGEVDLNWAKEHHSLWVEEVQGKSSDGTGDGSSRPGTQPAE